SAIQGELDKKLFAKIEEDGALDDAERAKLSEAAVRALRRVPEEFAGDALTSVYTQGDASLSSPGAARVRAAARAAVEGDVTEDSGAHLAAGVCPPAGRPKDEHADAEVDRLQKEVREAVRASFARALDAESISPATRNAMRGELEWLFTARDHTDDLG